MSDVPAVECGIECAGCTAECAACSVMACSHCDGCNHARGVAVRLLALRAWVAELALFAAAGGDPDEFAMPEELAEYWLHGEGAAQIGWCTKGSFRRAQRAMRGKIPAAQLDGAVANLYRRACGKNPGPHND